ncbi:BPSS1780 family membrane protein [Niveibacterium sp. 24ML]|uniref:BPSS1780 family membrane protein n=1 Tax=Niveibacterium sp. 24ML TaxID=2985512 RepID=UPI00226EE158|nr:BPSS1780 family membrane protein [Niveibacterium sp. 24ML]MCX9154744.1 BPSS1780 family membrane protein [Niveibacterium sp. 24ML]
MAHENPYAPPVATVFDAPESRSGSLELLHPLGRRVGTDRPWQWLQNAWALFKPEALKWWIVIAAATALHVAVIRVPGLSPFSLIVTLLAPLFLAGVGVCANNVNLTAKFSLTDLLAGFKHRPVPLLQVGACCVVLDLACLTLDYFVFGLKDPLVVFFGLGSDQDTERFMNAQGAVYWITQVGTSWLILSISAFAPYLIHEHGLSAPKAMFASAAGWHKNTPALLVLGFWLFVLAIGATIPFGLGWLALLPVLFLLEYCAYRDIYLASD